MLSIKRTKPNHDSDVVALGSSGSHGPRFAGLYLCKRQLWLWLIALACSSQVAAQDGEPPADNGTECGWDFLCHLQAFLEWAVCWLFETLRPVADYVLDLLPDESIEGAGTISGLVSMINAWFPLDYAIGFMAAYYVFITIFIFVKVVWKALPFTG